MATTDEISTASPFDAGDSFTVKPTIDPTENVKDLSEAANKRQDDLREQLLALVSAKLDSLAESTILRTQHNRALIEAEIRRLDEKAMLRADYQEKLSIAEAKRIDAIRAVDVNAVAVASQRASDQATVLASQVAQSAEALRALVASTAATNATSQQSIATTLSTRITTLEQAQYEGKGKQAFVDPAMIELMAEMKAMRGTRSEGIDKTWGIVGVVITIVISVTVAFISLNRDSHVQPVSQYVPAPTAVPAPVTIPIPPK